MTRVDETRCDVCESTITAGGLWLRLRRKFRVRLLEWGLTDLAPVTSGWRRRRVDLCGECWREVLDEVRDRVTETRGGA